MRQNRNGGAFHTTYKVDYDERGETLFVLSNGKMMIYRNGRMTKVMEGQRTLWQIDYGRDGSLLGVLLPPL